MFDDLDSDCHQQQRLRWLQVLLTEKFFNACVIHEASKKNEKNLCCLECCMSICTHCLPLHTSHRLLKIRRYVLNDVIRLADAQKLLDCDSVQSYTTNSAKVIFLNPRQPQTRQSKGSGNICNSCNRNLQDPFLFCSISCKVGHIIKERGVKGLSLLLHEHADCLSLSEPDSVLEPASSSCSGSYGGGGGGGGVVSTESSSVAKDQVVEVVRKKRSSLLSTVSSDRKIVSLSVSEIDGGRNLMNRRKKNPNRAPFY